MEIIELFLRIIPAYPLLYINYRYARFFYLHKKNKWREYICWSGVSCSFLLSVIGPYSTYEGENIYLLTATIILSAISVFAVISCFYYHFVNRPVPRDIDKSVDYEPLSKLK